MTHCPSRDWDRYNDLQQSKELLKIAHHISELYAVVDEYWWINEMLQEPARFTDKQFIWADGTTVVVPYNRDLKIDDAGVAIRTALAKSRQVKIQTCRTSPQELCIWVENPGSMHRYTEAFYCPDVPESDRYRLEQYLEFLKTEEQFWPIDFFGDNSNAVSD